MGNYSAPIANIHQKGCLGGGKNCKFAALQIDCNAAIAFSTP